jgi:hypothetical protein
MTISEIVNKAKEAGYDRIAGRCFDEMLIDPLFWQYLGKAMGWRVYEKYGTTHFEYLNHWHDLVDWLSDGKSTESFFDQFNPNPK